MTRFGVDTAHSDGSNTNEDLVTVTDNAAWVLDGASGLSDRQLVSTAPSDGRWYVDTFDEYLRDTITDTSRSLEQIVYDGIEHLALTLDDALTVDRADTLTTADPDQAVSIHEVPAATIALIRWNETDLEYLSLGDSVTLINTADGLHRCFHGDPEQFDACDREWIAQLRAEHPDASYHELRGFAHHRLEKKRLLRETPGGYWALGVNPVAARYAETGMDPLTTVEDVFLFTDGFDPLVERYGAFDSWEAATMFMRENGVDAAVDRLRAIEDADADMTSYPRLKPHDDVAIARLVFDESVPTPESPSQPN